MALKTIETKAIISAQDKTGATFSAVAQKLKKMEDTAHAASRGVRAAARAGVAAESASSKAYLAAGAGLRAAGLESFVAGAATALASGAAAHALVKAGSERIHETLRMTASGMSIREIQEATLQAAKIAEKFPSIKQTDIMHMLRNARTITGGFEEAALIMDEMTKIRVIAQNNRPGQDVTEDLDLLMKGIEIKGVTNNPKQFKVYMEGIAKGLNAFGDTLRPHQYYEMFKYGRQATPALSERFVLSTAPALAQELGGSSYGKAVSGFNSAIVGGVMKHSALKDFLSLGLINKDDLQLTKTGEAKGLKPGRHIQGWKTAQSDPDYWIWNYLLPALAKSGVTDKEGITARIGSLFQNAVAAQFVALLATQRQRIGKDGVMLAGAQGTAAADLFQSKDPGLAWQGLKNAGESLAASMGESLGRALAPEMNALARAIAGYTTRITQSDQDKGAHPGEQTTAKKNFNRLLNNIFLDTDSDKNVGDLSQDDNVKGSLNVLRGSPRRLRAARRRLAAALREHPSGFIDSMINSGERSNALDEIHDSEGDASKFRGLTFAHRAKLRALGNLARFRDYRDSIRPFEDRADRGLPIMAPGLLSFPSGMGYGDAGGALSLGGGRRGMSLPAWIGSAGRSGEGTVKLEGAAAVSVKVEVAADVDSVVTKVEQAITARGNLSNPYGVTMRSE
jgi:hypothetical protein